MMISLSKCSRGSRNCMDDIKVVTRGNYYLTPFNQDHIPEVLNTLTKESRYDLKCLGYTDVSEAMDSVIDESECYVAKSNNGPIICISGLFFAEDWESPQMFALFTNHAKKNFHVMARGSKMVVDFFDLSYPSMSMSILDEFSIMLNWAAWLGFEPVGFSQHLNNNYVEFVRCNPKEKNVSHKLSRPVMH